MKKNIYRVTFLTKKGGNCHWALDTEAASAKEAKQIAESNWQRTDHMFHLAARKLGADEEVLFNKFTATELEHYREQLAYWQEEWKKDLTDTPVYLEHVSQMIDKYMLMIKLEGAKS